MFEQESAVVGLMNAAGPREGVQGQNPARGPVRNCPALVRPHFGGWWGVLVVSLLVLSSVLMFPSSLPSASAASYGGQEPTPTNLTTFLHNATKPVGINGGIFADTLLNTTNDTAPGMTGEGEADTATACTTCIVAPFYLYPRLAGSLVLNGTPVANVYLNWTGTGAACTLDFAIYSISPSGTPTAIGTPASKTCPTSNKGSIGLPLQIAYGSPLDLSLPLGWSLEAQFTVLGSASAGAGYGLWWGNVKGSYFFSDIDLPASTYLNVNGTYIVQGGKATGSLNSTLSDKTVDLRANFTDPLGNYDYANWTAHWNISNVTHVVLASGKMQPMGPNVPPLGYGYNETYNATFNYSALPSGAYVLCVNETDNTEYNDLIFTGHWYGRNAQGCSSFFVGSAPNLLTLRVLDSKHVPLPGAKVSVSGVLNLTNVTGITHFRLSNGTYTGTVDWEGVTVDSVTINVSGATSLTLITHVYYPTFSIVDQAGVPLSNAFVYVVHPNGTHYPLAITNSTGNLSFTQVPQGSYGITVIWHDSVVYSQPSQPAISVAGNVTYMVVAQVYYQVFQVVEPSGAPIPLTSVVVENSTTGVLVSFGITNATGMTTSRIPAGTFTVLVYWQTSLIATVSGLSLPATTYPTPYVITASLYTVSFVALDSKGVPVSGAVIEVSGSGGPITNLVTSSAGTASVVLPGGNYTFTTLWQGVTVNQTSVTVASSSTLTLNLSIYYLTLTALDASGVPVGGAAVTYGTQVGSANGTLLLPANGSGTVRLPGATYTLKAFWEGIQVGSSSLTLSSSTTKVLSLSIFYLTFKARDAGGLPVSAASVQWTTPVGQANGTVSTNTTGAATVRLPGATYALTVSWEGVVVNTSSLALSSSMTDTLHLAIYYLTLHAVDAEGIAVMGTTITWVTPVGTANGSLTTNSTGEGMARLPGATYALVASWEGVTVNQTSYDLSSTVTLVLSLEVYYLTFQAHDAKNISVSGATVSLALHNGPVDVLLETPDNGSVVARVPTGSYSISVIWEGVAVYEGNVTASGDASVPLALQIYYLTVDTLDKGGSPLPGVFVQILSTKTDAVVASATTISQPTVFRLPVGSYAVMGTYKSTYDLTPVEQTLNQSVSLSASSTVTLKFTEVNPSFTSTNEFYVILGFVALGVLLILLALLLLRKRKGQESGKAASSPTASPTATEEKKETASPPPASSGKTDKAPGGEWSENSES